MRQIGMALLTAGLLLATNAYAQEKTPGVTDTEISIGQSAPFSGPASAFGIYGRVYSAYFQAVNDKGGINGRKIKFYSFDNGFSPPNGNRPVPGFPARLHRGGAKSRGRRAPGVRRRQVASKKR